MVNPLNVWTAFFHTKTRCLTDFFWGQAFCWATSIKFILCSLLQTIFQEKFQTYRHLQSTLKSASKWLFTHVFSLQNTMFDRFFRGQASCWATNLIDNLCSFFHTIFRKKIETYRHLESTLKSISKWLFCLLQNFDPPYLRRYWSNQLYLQITVTLVPSKKFTQSCRTLAQFWVRFDNYSARYLLRYVTVYLQ